MNKTLKKLLSVMSAMVFVVSAYAQVTTANIAGRVVDAQGPVAGAVVTAIHTATGTQYYSVVDKNGQYRINNILPGGPYTIKVESLGYRTAEVNTFYTAIGETSVNDFVLEDESLALDAVVVSADASDSGMNIRRSGAGTTVSQRTMENLPTSTSRSLNDVLKLTPQATTAGSGFAVGGGNYRSSYITVDGAAFNNAFGIGSNLPAGGSPISLDAIEQMSINITPYDVRQGGFTGAAVNSVTKSGTNEVKVSVYDYYTAANLVGTNYADKEGNIKQLPFTDSKSNTVGFTVGGPIIKNKLFFFVNFEYEPKSAPATNWTTNDAGNWTAAGTGTVHRATSKQMDDIKDYLSKNYNGYNPGRYQNFSVDIPVTKILARVDWNINKNNKLTLRYSQVERKGIKLASDSVNPIGDGADNVGYTKKTGGRKTVYCLPFESAYYYEEDNFYSFAGELNSRLFDGKATNMLRGTYSHQNIPRSFYGSQFPTVDILEETDGVNGVLTTIGPDPFTYGNLRDVETMVFTDELSWASGINNFIAGVQYEHNITRNGFMQGGAGWYTFASWDAFKNNELPVSFCITHGNNDELAQVYPSFDYNQFSAYFQDEMNISDNFKLTAGIRFELPMYPLIEGNENKNFTNVYANYGGYKTSDMPATSLAISPRIGFNWDVVGDRSFIVRGGTGVYTGRMPFVWIVSVAGNSNCLQNQVIMTAKQIRESTDGKVNGVTIPHFHQSVADITTEMYGGEFHRNENLAAPSATTIIDKNLKMPTTWKTSLAADFNLPGGIKGSLEGIYNKNFNSTVVKKLGYEVEGSTQFPGEPEARVAYKAIDAVGSVHPYLITNPEKGVKQGGYFSLTATLKKNFDFGLNLMAAYTYATAKGLTDGDGDQISSAFDNNLFNINGGNSQELGYSSFVTPNRLILNADYRVQSGKHHATNFGLFYEGYNYGMVGTYGSSRYSYTMDVDYTGCGGSADLLYIPTSAELAKMPFSAPENKAAYEAFLANDKYLSKHRGEYSQRGGAVMPWFGVVSFKVSEDFMFDVLGKTHTLRLGVDINNVGNFLNPKWGNVKQIASTGALTLADGVYTFNENQCKFDTYANPLSTWSMLFSARYFF